MCAMTGLNIQSLVLLEDGVIIWQVFIRILRYYGTKLAGSIVKILCKTQVSGGAATLPLTPLGRGFGRGAYQEGRLFGRRRTGCQEVKPLSVLCAKITFLLSLPS